MLCVLMHGDPTFAPATIAPAMTSPTTKSLIRVMIGLLVRGRIRNKIRIRVRIKVGVRRLNLAFIFGACRTFVLMYVLPLIRIYCTSLHVTIRSLICFKLLQGLGTLYSLKKEERTRIEPHGKVDHQHDCDSGDGDSTEYFFQVDDDEGVNTFQFEALFRQNRLKFMQPLFYIPCYCNKICTVNYAGKSYKMTKMLSCVGHSTLFIIIIFILCENHS